MRTGKQVLAGRLSFARARNRALRPAGSGACSLLLWIALALGLFPAATAHAADYERDPEGYRAAIDAAVQEYELNHFEESREQFARAHALNPNARTLRGLGVADFELRRWTNGALRASDGTERSYRGYYLRYRFDSWTGSFGADCALTSVPASRWNSLTMNLGTGVSAPITINGSSAGSCSPPFVTAGTAKVRLGLSSTLPILWQVYYDNVVVSVRR